MTLRIAMWSGPRNLSTAMMYAFAARGDCAVSDEPFYAAYLAATGLDHPMRDAVLASQPTDPAHVALDGEGPSPAPIWYQKHMTQHMLPGVPTGWMAACRHAFLIRHPARVIASYVRKREDPTLEDIGFLQQRDLFDRVAQDTGSPPRWSIPPISAPPPPRCCASYARPSAFPGPSACCPGPPGRNPMTASGRRSGIRRCTPRQGSTPPKVRSPICRPPMPAWPRPRYPPTRRWPDTGCGPDALFVPKISWG